jgi:hypothetical protein
LFVQPFCIEEILSTFTKGKCQAESPMKAEHIPKSFLKKYYDLDTVTEDFSHHQQDTTE